MLKMKVKLLETEASLRRKVVDALLSKLKVKYPNLAQTIIKKFQFIFLEELRSSSTYKALQSGGELAVDFGFEIDKAQKYLNNLEGIWSMQNKILKNDLFKVKNTRYFGSIKIGFIEADFTFAMNSEDAGHYVSITKRGNINVDWLEWLLFGGFTIDTRYRIWYKRDWGQYGDKTSEQLIKMVHVSRTGEALMKRSTQGWRVNRSFAGTSNNNWITKVLDIVKVRLGQEIIKLLKSGT